MLNVGRDFKFCQCSNSMRTKPFATKISAFFQLKEQNNIQKKSRKNFSLFRRKFNFTKKVQGEIFMIKSVGRD